jgi:hypothetical protein
MTQALSELRAPVAHEALRLRMVALHGREDPLLESARFTRLLRQANDAEIADVRKVGEDEYEVTPHRTSAVPAIAAPAASSAAVPAAAAMTDEFAAVAPEAPAEPGRSDNGQRLGLRFRRGSRGQLRPGEIPLIGVVQMDTPAEPAAAVAVLEPAGPEKAAAPRKPARPRAPRKKAAAAAAISPAPDKGDDAAPAAPRAKRTRARAKKKAE